MRFLAATILLCVSFLANAALSEAEKNLLSSSISADRAAEMGKANDAAGLARIIALGDPGLVSSFGRAMPRVEPLPPAIESQVLAHFDDPRVGAALRAMAIRYQTRALFNRFYAVAEKAYQDRDPVFEYLLRTDQPGIDEAVLKLAPRFPTRGPGSLNPALDFLGKRKYPGAVDALIAALGADDRGNGYSPALSLLLHYERMHGDGRLIDTGYKQARSQLDAALKDPPAAVARLRREENTSAYYKRAGELYPLAADAAKVRADPPRYLEAQAKYVAGLDAFAATLDDARVDVLVAFEYTGLGMFALLRANDPKAAVPFFEKAAKHGDPVGAVALADTLEQGLGDKPAAIRAYQAALAAATEEKGHVGPFGTMGDPKNEFWRAWFSAEIEYLQTGKPFRGRVSEPAITGFWGFVQSSKISMSIYSRIFNEATPPRPTVTTPARNPASAPGHASFGIVDDGLFRSDWEKVAGKYRSAAAPEQAGWLGQLPASRMSLVVSMRELSALGDPAAILSQLAHDDPSGFWTTIILGTVDYHESHGRDGALDDGVATYLPGMAAPAQPNPLAVAAKRFMQSRDMRVRAK
jgi:tetratricopeptide (TPR) repeat protein